MLPNFDRRPPKCWLPDQRDLFRRVWDAALSRPFGMNPESDWCFGDGLPFCPSGRLTKVIFDCLLLGREIDLRNRRGYLLRCIYQELLSINDLSAWYQQVSVYEDAYAQFFGTTDRPGFIWVNPVWRPWGFRALDPRDARVTTESSVERARLQNMPRRVSLEFAPGVEPIQFDGRRLVFAYRTARDPRLMVTVRRPGHGREYNLGVFSSSDIPRIRQGSQTEVMKVAHYADHYRFTPISKKRISYTPVVMLGTLHEDTVGGWVRYMTDRIHPGNAELIAWTGVVRSFRRMMHEFPWLRDIFVRATS